MAEFVDILTAQLFVLGFSGLLLFYAATQAWLLLRKKKDPLPTIKSVKVPLAVLGVYVIITGLFGQFAWPLPGSYNILFYDMFAIWGFVLVGVAMAFHLKAKVQYMGFLGLMLGAITIIYGYMGYVLHMTQSPLMLFGMYGLFGLSGILSYPASIVFDRAEQTHGHKISAWTVLVALFAFSLLAASVLALVTGIAAVPAHLLSPP